MKKNPPIIKKIAMEMGGEIEEIIPKRGYFNIKIAGKKIFVSRKFKIADNLLAGGETTKFKDLTYLILKENNLPTPKTVCIYDFEKEKLKQDLESLKFPIIIKDAQGSQSKGIFADIKNVDEGLQIIQEQLINFPRMIAQEMIIGTEFRILVLDGKLLGALEFISPRIKGDGIHSVVELIDEKQKNTEKKTPQDDNLKRILNEQGVSLESILEINREIFIRKNSSLAEGGETRDVTNKVNKKIIEICSKAAKATGKKLAGLDVFCEDISKGPEEQNFNIIEINGKPDIYIHYNPTHGETRNVVKEIIEFILKLKNV